MVLFAKLSLSEWCCIILLGFHFSLLILVEIAFVFFVILERCACCRLVLFLVCERFDVLCVRCPFRVVVVIPRLNCVGVVLFRGSGLMARNGSEMFSGNGKGII